MERCSFCRKKINMMSFKCKFCDINYCCKHQLPETHKCNIRESASYERYRLKDTSDYKPLTKLERLEQAHVGT